MKKTTSLAPAIALAMVLSAAMMMGIPPIPQVAETATNAKEKKDDPEEPKRIFDRRIAWGPAPEVAASWDHILAQYDE
ncbi:hypothetical protein [Parapedobacter defluvii]|uniref:hypothetical protein n=1 Tax=Parapedobacter defluvii TaxID=2045106 RepID=UPI003340B8A9